MLDSRRFNSRSYDQGLNGGFLREDAAIAEDSTRSATMFDVINKASDAEDEDVY